MKPSNSSIITPEPRRGGVRIGPIALWSFGLVLFYVLSVGPVGKLYERYDVSPDAAADRILTVVYAPLFRATEKSTTMQAFYRWYLIDVWGLTPPGFYLSP